MNGFKQAKTCLPSSMLSSSSIVHVSYLPTSGDLKSGDSLFCTKPPPQPSRQQIALGHYMTSYMKYMESKCPFVIVMRN